MYQITSNKTIQPKLSIGQPGDKYEQEADAMADKVMSMPKQNAPIQRQCENCEEESLQMKPLVSSITPMVQMEPMKEENDMMQAKPESGGLNASASLSSQLSQSKGSGTGLSDATNQNMSNAFGTDFSGVRIHTDSNAIHMNRSLNARAFAHGSDVYFNQGEYNPDNNKGKHLLAHELTHVVQQKSGERIQRVCDCTTVPGGITPTPAEDTFLASNFPNLRSGDYCITGGATPDYNCHAHTVGVTNDFRTGPEIDRGWGNGDGIVSYADFDAYYAREANLSPAVDSCPDDAKAVLFENSVKITHSAKIVNTSCGVMAESKLGNRWKILHQLHQLEGGSYGNVARYYH